MGQSGPTDIKGFNDQLKAAAITQQAMAQQRKQQDSKPVFNSGASNLGGMQNDVENNPFLHYYHVFGKNVDNLDNWVEGIFESDMKPETDQALMKFVLSASKLVHDASSVYATRGTDIEHDADSWGDLVQLVKDFENLVQTVYTHPVDTPDPTPEFTAESNVGIETPKETQAPPTLDEVIAKAKEQANVQQSSPDSGQSNEGN